VGFGQAFEGVAGYSGAGAAEERPARAQGLLEECGGFLQGGHDWKISDLKFQISDWAFGLLFGRVSIGQGRVEPLDKGVGFFLLLVAVAFGVVEVALAFDAGVLQKLGPFADLFGTGFSLQFQI
jgi:hypothetical protein